MAAIRAIKSSITRSLCPSRPRAARMDAAFGVAAARRAGRPHPCWCGRPNTPTRYQECSLTRGSVDAVCATRILSEEVFRGLVETTLSRVVFRNMTSEDLVDDAPVGRRADQGRTDDNRAAADRAAADQAAQDRAAQDRAAQ